MGLVMSCLDFLGPSYHLICKVFDNVMHLIFMMSVLDHPHTFAIDLCDVHSHIFTMSNKIPTMQDRINDVMLRILWSSVNGLPSSTVFYGPLWHLRSQLHLDNWAKSVTSADWRCPFCHFRNTWKQEDPGNRCLSTSAQHQCHHIVSHYWLLQDLMYYWMYYWI